MSVHNTLRAGLACPHCGTIGLQDIEVFFGLGNLLEYKVGDRVTWVPRKAPQNGGRPAAGRMISRGYAECESCGRSFFVRVVIELDKIATAEIDPSQADDSPRR
jgi:hypothetical protein